jgi:ketosteroid isomerase-like protein
MDFKVAYDGLRRSYEQGMRLGDPLWVAGLFAEDGVIQGPGMEPLVGREPIRAYEQEFLGAFQVNISIIPTEIQQCGDKGWGSGTWRATLVSRAGGEPVEVTGKFLNIVQPRADGTLEIIRHCWSSDQPIPQ